MFSNNIYHFAFLFFDFLLLLICVLNWLGKIHFGLGIADLPILIILVIGMIILNAIYYFSNNTGSVFYDKQWLILGVLVMLTFFAILKMTILRGDASPWNGQILF